MLRLLKLTMMGPFTANMDEEDALDRAGTGSNFGTADGPSWPLEDGPLSLAGAELLPLPIPRPAGGGPDLCCETKFHNKPRLTMNLHCMDSGPTMRGTSLGIVGHELANTSFFKITEMYAAHHNQVLLYSAAELHIYREAYLQSTLGPR